MTQNTTPGSSKFVLWLMDRNLKDDPELVSLASRYEKQLSVEFKQADLFALAKGTCLAGRADYLSQEVPANWHPSNHSTMGPKEKADMVRMMILHKYGGVWVDTDTIILRDLRPLAEWLGEFAAKVTLSAYYNNNVLGIRKKSPVAKKMLDYICQTPFTGRSNAQEYCQVVGTPCYPKWWWNHGIIQMAVRNSIGLSIVPWSFTDPSCMYIYLFTYR